MKLISKVLSGNCHEVVIALNSLRLARFVLCMECNGTNMTNVALRTEGPAEWYHVRRRLQLPHPEYEL